MSDVVGNPEDRFSGVAAYIAQMAARLCIQAFAGLILDWLPSSNFFVLKVKHAHHILLEIFFMLLSQRREVTHTRNICGVIKRYDKIILNIGWKPV